jgi:putative ABC transport system permease protein
MIAAALLRHRWPAFAGTLLTLALGVALIAGTLLVYSSAKPQMPQRYAHTPLFVRTAAAPWDAHALSELTARLSAVDGVSEVIPERSFYAQVFQDGHPVGKPDKRDPQGHSWSTAKLAPYPVADGRAPQADDEVVLSRAYAFPVGSAVTLLTASGLSAYHVVGVIDGPGIYVSDRAAQRFAPGVSLVGVQARPGTVLSVDGATVLRGDARRELESQSDSHVRWIGAQLLVAMVMLAGFAAVFVVASTFAFAVHQRRGDFALLRAIGATPRQIRRTVYACAAGVGLAGALIGVVLGAVAAPLLGGVLVAVGFEPPGFSVSPSPAVLAVSYVVGVLVALLGAGSAARRTAWISPLAALRTAAVDRRPMTRSRWIWGVAAIAVGVCFAVLVAGADGEDIMRWAMLSAIALVVGLCLLSPVVVPPLVRLVPGLLVRSSALTAVRRTASTAAPVLVTVGFAALILGQVATISEAYKGGGPSAPRAAVVVAPSGTAGLSAAVLAALPPSAVSVTPTTVYLAGVATDAVGLSSASGVCVSTGLSAGSSVSLTFADGTTVTLPVSSVSADLPAPIVLPLSVVRTHDPSALAAAAYVDGHSVDDVRARVAGLGATAVAGADYESLESAYENRLVRVFVAVLLGISLGYTGLAIVNTLAMATADRLGDFAVLRRTGASRRQVVRMVGLEAALVVVLGTLLGLLVSIPALLGVRAGIADSLGRPVDLVIPWAPLAGVVGACLAFAVLAATVPTSVALRRNVLPGW